MRRLMLLVGAVAMVATSLGCIGCGGGRGAISHDPVALRSCLQRYGWSDVGERIPGYTDVLLQDDDAVPQRDLVVAFGSEARERLGVGVSEALLEWDEGEVKVRGEEGDVAWAATGEAGSGSSATPHAGASLGGTFTVPAVDPDQTVRDAVATCLQSSRTSRVGTGGRAAETPHVAVAPAGTAGRDWLITDFGTLGGKRSAAVAINERGQIVGTSTTADEYGDPHAFLWERGTMRDLGTLGGFTSRAVAINGRGQVVGDRIAQGGSTHIFLWQDGRMTDVGPASPHWGIAVAINENGQIIASGSEASAFLWSNGRTTDLGRFGTVAGINDGGQVVADQFLWEHGKDTDIDPGRSGSVAVAINNRGQVVGNREVGNQYFDWTHAFLWQNGRATDLGTLEKQDASVAVAINNRGETAGNNGVPVPSQGPREHDHAVVWTDGRIIDLGTLDESLDWSDAAAINERGDVVGWSAVATGKRGTAAEHAFVWQDGTMTDLGTLPGGKNSRAVAINNHNQIVGWSTTKNGQRHAVLWTLRRSA